MASILVVEDERIVAEDIQKSLQNLGYTILAVVSSGEKAIQKARGENPDLVLMDIVLKGEMDGIEAAERIYSQFNIPVVYLTAYADEKKLQRAKVTEPYGYLLKPFEERGLHTTIEMALYKHRMEKKVRESEQWLFTTLKSIGDAVIATDTQGLVTFMNPVAETLTGWNQKDAVGRPLDDILTIVDEETGRKIENPAQRALQGIAQEIDHKMLTRNGVKIHIDECAAPIKDDKGTITGVVVVLRDITKRTRAERALKRAEKKFRDLFDYASDAIFIHDMEGHFLEVNRTACERLGYAREELLQMTPTDIDPPECAVLVPDQIDDLKEKGHLFFETAHITKDGKTVPIELSSKIIEFEGIPAILSIARDITERKKAEMQLKTLFETSKLINSTIDMADIYRFISDSIQNLVGFDNFMIFLVSKDKKHIYCTYASEGIKDRIESMAIYYGEGLVGRCIATGEPLLLKNRSRGAETSETMGMFASQIVVPLVIEGECVGALHILKAAENAYDQKDVEALKPLSEVISSAVRNSTLYNEIKKFGEELEKRIEERSKKIEILLNTRMSLQGEGSWQKGLKTIVESIGKLGFDRCDIFLVNPLRKTLDFHFGKGIELPEKNTSISLGNSEHSGVKCVREKRTIRVRDFRLKEGKNITSDSESFVWVPIVVQNEAFAALGADNVLSNRSITDEDVKDLEILAGMCAAFIDRTRMLIQPVAEKMLETELKHRLDPAECYIVPEKRPEKSVEIFCDLTTHGIPGFVISRMYPEKLRRKHNLVKTPMLWLSRSEKGDAISPDDLPKLKYIIGDFTRKSTDSVILLDGAEYLMTQTSFITVLKFLQELKDMITLNNSRLIIPLHKDTIPLKEYSILERELTVL
ncbi:MAG: PAS domain S-box protein [Theionarchaea archaeon]|nr:PAS domain S-box protein [Theionarchaea archaeon]